MMFCGPNPHDVQVVVKAVRRAPRRPSFSPTNSLILNFKKPPDRRGKPEWQHKERAIQRAATAFRGALGAAPLRMTFVPVPPSKARDDRLYDDRVTRMLRAIWSGQTPDIRESPIQSTNTTAAHESLARPTPQQIAAGYQIDEALTLPEPAFIAIVDDVLTTGAHFRAASAVLAARFPTAQIVGLFVARRVPDANPAS